MSAAILLSGGIESSALAAWKRPEHAITVDYGQASAETELRVSRQISAELGITHHAICIDARQLGSGLLAHREQIPHAPTPEWWPYRNQFLITAAAMLGLQFGVTEVMIGTVKSDTGHADSAPEFIHLLDQLLQFQEGGMRLSAPADELTAIELVSESKMPLSLLAATHSCHTGNLACGSCRGCQKHAAIIDALCCAS